MDTAAFGRFVAACRREKQLTQAQLAEMLHVTSKAVSRWERGVGYPDITTLEPLAAALGLSLAELLACARTGTAQGPGGEASAVPVRAAEQKPLQRAFWRLFGRALAAVAGLFLLSALAQYLVDVVLLLPGRISDFDAGLVGLGLLIAKYLTAALVGLLLRARHRALLAQGPLLRRRWALGLAACLPVVLLLLGPDSRLMWMLEGCIYNLIAQGPGLWPLVVVCEAFFSLDFGLCVLACALLVFMPLWRPKRERAAGQGGAAAQP